VSQSASHPPGGGPPPWSNESSEVLSRVREALSGLRYGQVTVIVQDGVVVQVERTDRVRLSRPERVG
jgi:hypothetical protein